MKLRYKHYIQFEDIELNIAKNIYQDRQYSLVNIG